MKIDDYVAREKAFLKMEKEQDMWVWSLQPHKAEDIIFAEIMNAQINEEPIVSATYYCGATHLTEKDVDNLLYINSGLFTYEGWDDEVVEFVIGLLMKGNGANVYQDLRDVVAKGKYNIHFRRKCAEICNAAVDLKLISIKNRKDDVNSSVYHLFQGLKSLTDALKEGRNDKASRLRIQHSFDEIEPRLEKLRVDLESFEDFSVKLCDRLDWKILIRKGNLSEEYLERRKPLWESAMNSHN